MMASQIRIALMLTNTDVMRTHAVLFKKCMWVESFVCLMQKLTGCRALREGDCLLFIGLIGLKLQRYGLVGIKLQRYGLVGIKLQRYGLVGIKL
jgi:hypothetical protein